MILPNKACCHHSQKCLQGPGSQSWTRLAQPWWSCSGSLLHLYETRGIEYTTQSKDKMFATCLTTVAFLFPFSFFKFQFFSWQPLGGQDPMTPPNSTTVMHALIWAYHGPGIANWEKGVRRPCRHKYLITILVLSGWNSSGSMGGDMHNPNTPPDYAPATCTLYVYVQYFKVP